jgi:signal transduction histidine kinase
MNELALPPVSGMVGLVYRNRQPYLFEDVPNHPAYQPVGPSAPEAPHSALGVPLLVEGRPIGALFSDSFSPLHTFDDDDLRVLQSLANQAAIAIENARLFEQVRDSRKRLQALSHRLVLVQEEERRYVAHELHDQVGQLLTSLNLTLDMSSRLPPDALRTSLQEAETLVRELMSRVRNLSLDLRPAMLDDLGLLAALLWHFERYTSQTGVQVLFKHVGLEEQHFSPEVETAAYRIIQEALTNVARHAEVDEVAVRLRAEEDMLDVLIEDEGSGFDAEAALAAATSVGLAGMNERATLLGGQLTVDSSPGAGTCVRAELPLGDRLERRKEER